MAERFHGSLKDERGQALAETALLLAFIFVVCVIAVGQFGLELTSLYEEFVEAYPG